MHETDRFAKTRRKCIPAGSVAASLLLTVLANLSVSRTLSDRPNGSRRPTSSRQMNRFDGALSGQLPILGSTDA